MGVQIIEVFIASKPDKRINKTSRAKSNSDHNPINNPCIAALTNKLDPEPKVNFGLVGGVKLGDSFAESATIRSRTVLNSAEAKSFCNSDTISVRIAFRRGFGSRSVSVDKDDSYSKEEAERRRDAALLRALSTPHKKQTEMKVGKRRQETKKGQTKERAVTRPFLVSVSKVPGSKQIFAVRLPRPVQRKCSQRCADSS